MRDKTVIRRIRNSYGRFMGSEAGGQWHGTKKRPRGPLVMCKFYKDASALWFALKCEIIDIRRLATPRPITA